MHSELRLSIITPALNSERTIRATLESVAQQDYPLVEHIVEDGASTDRTLDIVAEFPTAIVHSAKDEGHYDAMNRGVARSTGDFVAILNSDDCYRPGALRVVADALARNPRWDGAFGDTVFVDGEGREIYRRPEARFDYDVLRFGLCYVIHPTFFLRRSVFDALGGFRHREFSNCCDYDLFLRVARGGYPIGHVDAYVANYRYHDFGQSADRRVKRQMQREGARLQREHGRPDGVLGATFNVYARLRRQLQKLVLRGRLDVLPGTVYLRSYMRDKTSFSSNRGVDKLEANDVSSKRR